VHTRRFLYSLTVAAAAVSLSLAARATSAAAAERDHDGSSRAQHRDRAAARERSHDGHVPSVLKAASASSAHAVHEIAPSGTPAPPPARAQQTAALITRHPSPPVLSFPTVPVAPPASGSVIIGGTQPPLNLATIVTLVVAGAVVLLATHLARRPA
jgi:Ni/Co efflux regulator RcnB